MSMNLMLTTIIMIFAAYLVGSIPFAVIISKIMGLQDPRKFGSKNPGATNVLRTGNKTAAVLTLLGDVSKGAFAVIISSLIVKNYGLSFNIVAMVALAVFIGHVYPLFLGFKGGKGVATAMGVLIGINIWFALIVAATWLFIAFVFRYSSLAAIFAAVLAPTYYVIGADSIWPMQASFALAITTISVILLFRHKTNISRLLKGKESKIGSK